MILFMRKSFITKRFSVKEILLLIGLFLGAILLKFTMFQNTMHHLYYDYDVSKSLAYKLFCRIPFLRDYTDIIYPVYRFFSSFFRYLPKYILNWPVLLFLVLLSTSGRFREKIKDMKEFFIFVFVFFIVTITIGCLFIFPGAEMYHAWYIQIVFLLLGVISLDYILDVKGMNYRIIAVSLLVLSAILFAKDLIGWVKVGWGGLPNHQARIWNERASISYGEWSAMRWLRENTAPDEIFFSDRRYVPHESRRGDFPRFSAYTALSGRQAFAEGETETFRGEYKAMAVERWKLIDEFLSSTDLARQKALLKDIKADYFVQSLRFNKRDFSKADNLNLVYENEDIKIFKILR